MYMVNVTYGTNISPDTLVELAFHGIHIYRLFVIYRSSFLQKSIIDFGPLQSTVAVSHCRVVFFIRPRPGRREGRVTETVLPRNWLVIIYLHRPTARYIIYR